MRIERLHAIAFGPFRNRLLEFAPRMTVLYGPNEAGKSSWHAALYAAICGMRRGAGLKKEDRAFSAQHKPWEGREWAVSVRVALDDGRRIELHQDLAGRVDSRAVDLVTGEDISGVLIFDGSPDASVLLGLNRRMFLSTVCVRQADILSLQSEAEGLQSQLERAAATGGQDEMATAEQAIRRIDEYQKQRVGTARANSTKPLRTATDARAQAQERLAQAKEAHEAYLDLVHRRDRAEHEAREAENQLAALRVEVAWRQVDELEVSLERARELAATLADSPDDLTEDSDLATSVADALAAYRTRPDVSALPPGPSADELEKELATLPPPPKGDLESAAEVITARESWRDIQRRLQLHQEQEPDAPLSRGHPASPVELRQAADDLEVVPRPVEPQLEGEIDALRRTTSPRPGSHSLVSAAAGLVSLAVGVVLTVTGLTLAGVLVAGLGLGLGTLGLILGSRARVTDRDRLAQFEARLAVQQEAHRQAAGRREAARRRTSAWELPADPTELRRIARDMDDDSERALASERWRQRTGDLEAALHQAEQTLREELATRAVSEASDPSADPERLFQAYRAACRERTVQHAEAVRRPSLESQLQALRAAEEAIAKADAKRGEAERYLLEIAERAGVAGDHPDVVVMELERWRVEHEQRLDARHEAEVHRASLEELLKGRTIEELEDEVANRRSQLPSRAGPAELAGGSHLDEQVESWEDSARRLRSQADSLAGQVAEREHDLPEVAEAEEQLARAETELGRVQELDRILQRTREFLEVARDEVQRDIAPRLAEALSTRIATISSGRYTEAIVNPATLEVKVRSATGKLRNASLLSRGTTEQIYLLLRLAMAEHLAVTGETAPFIIDDALVQTDSTRAASVLDLLHGLSDQRQIIVFSQEDDVLAWAQVALVEPRDRLIELDFSNIPP